MLIFVLLTTVLALDSYSEGIKLLKSEPRSGVLMLERAAVDNPKALMALGDFFLFNSSRNATTAFKYYSKLADLGSPIGHRMVGLLHATGIGIVQDYAKAHLFMGLAVIGGDALAMQVFGYWKKAGIATLKSCDDAMFYYQKVADGIVQEFYSHHPLGKNQPADKKNLAELEFGGIYSDSSGPGNPKVQQENKGLVSNSDIIEYYSVQADAGDKAAQILVAQVYYRGSHKVQVDYVKAKRYALMAYKQKPIEDSITKNELEKYSTSGTAADLLGKMYWRGEGVESNPVAARRWFEKGAAVNNAACMYSLGLMYEQGLAGLEMVSLLCKSRIRKRL